MRPDTPQILRRSPGPPLFLPPRKRPCNRRGRQKRTLPPRPNCPPIRGKRPKTERAGTCACTADASARSPAAAFFLPRRRERDSMRTEERERQAKGKRRKRHKRQNGERETGRQETEKTRKTDSPENGFGPAANRCGRAESFEDRRSGQPEPSRFRTLSIGNNRLCKVLRH